MVTFAVDEVIPAADLLPTQDLFTSYPDAVAMGGNPTLQVLAPDGVHPLLSAVARAFAEHRPLVLSPDAVWLTVTQGVAQHIRLNAEELRPKLVGHAGRKPLTIRGPSRPGTAEAWADLVEQFGKMIAHDAALTDLFACDFSTSTPVERIASQVVLLDAYSPYFSLWAVAVCGIPTITLTGTVEDWRAIRARVDLLDEFGLELWQRSLVPITDQFVRAAAGDPDTSFWQRIYNPEDAYGGDVLTGWIGRFYPYLKYNGTIDTPNPMLDLPIREPRNTRTPAIRTDLVPAVLATAQINLVGGEGPDRVSIHGGLVGIAQDSDGALCPVAGWHMTECQVPIDAVIDRIIEEHAATPAESIRFFDGSAEVIALDRRLGSADLFDGAWRLLPRDRRSYVVRSIGWANLTTLFQLPGDRFLAMATDWESVHWAVCRIDLSDPQNPRLIDDPADVPLYGSSLALILEAALDTDGDFSHLQTGTLRELDRKI